MELKDLGLTKKELQTLVVNAIVNKLTDADEEGILRQSQYAVEQKRAKAINEAVDTAVKESIDPILADAVKNVVMQETNQWGEPKPGAPTMTFKALLVDRLERYMMEEVNYEGKTRNQDSYGSWKAQGTRITYEMHKYLHYHMENAMKQVVGNRGEVIAKAIEEAMKINLAEMAKQLTVTAKVK